MEAIPQKNKKRLTLEVTDIAALQAEYPDAVKKVVIVKEDYSRLYELAQAHFTIGKPIAGVKITHPDGRVMNPAGAPAAANDSVPSVTREFNNEGDRIGGENTVPVDEAAVGNARAVSNDQ